MAKRASTTNIRHEADAVVRILICRLGIRNAVRVTRLARRIARDMLHEQQRKHPEDWPRLKRPAQPVQTEPSEAKNTTKIPQIPRVAS